MTFENSWVKSLNSWGLNHSGLVKFFGDSLVYIVLGLAALWIVRNELHRNSLKNFGAFAKAIIKDGILNFAIPLGAAVVFSELLSKLVDRSRPFVTVDGVKLVFPHTADGGMPSHHVLFMVALATCIHFRDKLVGNTLIVLALISGLARIAAGIHFPSDIIVGAVLGYAVVRIYQWALSKTSLAK